ncbi:MAG: hypothetical protein EZS28_013887, partial [Streblomastix strix]
VILFIIASHPSAILQPIFSLPFFYDTDSFVYRNEYLQSILLQLKEVAFESENKIQRNSLAKRGVFSNKECKKYIPLITGSIAMYFTLFKALKERYQLLRKYQKEQSELERKLAEKKIASKKIEDEKIVFASPEQ